jgi:hypothetical protein
MFEAYSHSNHEGLIAASCIEKEVRFGSITSGSLRPLLGRSCRRVTSAASGIGAHQLTSRHSPGRYIGMPDGTPPSFTSS